MIWSPLIGVAGFVVPLVLALAIGPGRRRQLALALAGLVFWGAWIVYWATVGCVEGYSCSGGFVVFGAFGLLWLAGIGAAALVSRDGGRPGWRTLAVAVTLLLLIGAAVVYGRYGSQIARWGCPTEEELSRNQSVEEVMAAFEDSGLPVEPIESPVWVPPGEPAYRGARVFRHATPQATVYVVVCRGRCSISRLRFADARVVGEQRWYMSLESNNNVPILVTEAGRGDGRRMLEAMKPALREVHPYVEYGSRCYIR